MTQTGSSRRRGPDPRAVRSTRSRSSARSSSSALVGWVVVNAPGWPEVQASFFNADIFWASLPAIVRAFVVNVQLFLIAEVFILVFGLVLAVHAQPARPVFFPLRLMSIVYTDIFRAVPGILVIYVLGFGMPGLGLVDPRTDRASSALVALTLVYSAYVSEVYRAGIESIHPSQDAAARSLGLSRLQALRYVVLPQAVRRVIPPLLNDFIGLQKDTVLVSFIGVVEVFRTPRSSRRRPSTSRRTWGWPSCSSS